MSKYILVGSNNFWFGYDTSLKRIKQQAKEILKNNSDSELEYSDPETGTHPFVPNSIYIFEVKEINKYHIHNN